MKELLKHYKEVKEKAKPESDYWRMKQYVHTFNGKPIVVKDESGKVMELIQEDDKFYFWTDYDVDPNEILTYQKQQLELENLLYEYWDRTEGNKPWRRQEGYPSKATDFTEWLEDQLKSLEDE